MQSCKISLSTYFCTFRNNYSGHGDIRRWQTQLQVSTLAILFLILSSSTRRRHSHHIYFFINASSKVGLEVFPEFPLLSFIYLRRGWRMTRGSKLLFTSTIFEISKKEILSWDSNLDSIHSSTGLIFAQNFRRPFSQIWILIFLSLL